MIEEKFVKLARAARAENNVEDAKKYYEMMYIEMPDNAEAKWYYTYYTLMDCKNVEIPEKYVNVCASLVPSLKLATFIEDEKEKAYLVLDITSDFIKLKNAVISSILKIDALPSSYVQTVKKTAQTTERRLGDDIIEIFGEVEPYTTYAVNIWKRLIDERHMNPYRNYQDKDKTLWFEEMAKKIQKYEPNYIMPEFKQAGGCVTGDAAEIRPGE